MIFSSAAIGFIAGSIFGFKTGASQWRCLGVLGSFIDGITAISIFNFYTMLNFESEMALAAGIGGCLLGNAMCAPLGSAFNA